jgi:hypothetical protein
MKSQSFGTAVWQSLQRRWLIAAIFLGALLTQIAFLVLLPDSARANQSTDFTDYYSPVAQHLLSGQSLTDGAGNFATLYPPGYPVFLAGSFWLADRFAADRTHFVIFLNTLLFGLGCLLVFWTAEVIFNSRVGLLASALWGTYIFNLWLIKQPNTEILFIPLFYGGVYCLTSAIEHRSIWMALVCGFLVGLSALVRPMALLLVFLLAAAILVRRTIELSQRMFLAAVLVGAFFITILPWECDVYIHTREVVPLCTNGPSAMLDGLTFLRRTRDEGLPAPVVQFMNRAWSQHQDLKTTGAILRYEFAELKRDPKAVLELTGLKIIRSWFGTDSRSFEYPILLVQLFYLSLGALGLSVAWRRFRERRYYVELFVVLVLYFWGMTILALSILRYMVPVMAYLLIPGAVAIDAYFLRGRKVGEAQAQTRQGS